MATSQRRLSAILHGGNGTSVDAGREAQHVAAAFRAVRSSRSVISNWPSGTTKIQKALAAQSLWEVMLNSMSAQGSFAPISD
jgi:hypothetical protein